MCSQSPVDDLIDIPAQLPGVNRAALYRVPLKAGASARPGVTVGGDLTQVEGFYANGIASTPRGSALLVVHSTLGVATA